MVAPSAHVGMGAAHARAGTSSRSGSSSMSSTTTRNSSSASTTGGANTTDAGPYPEPEGRIQEVPNLCVFTFAELKAATKNFIPDTALGSGGFGRVYKGWINEKTMNPARSSTGMVIAIKKLNPGSVQGLQEWQPDPEMLKTIIANEHRKCLADINNCGRGSLSDRFQFFYTACSRGQTIIFRYDFF